MKKSIEVRRTATYHFLPAESSKYLLYVIHGYGQLAEDFIEVFKSLEGKINIIAPEGLSRYYNKERKPVASWMTSHEREAEMRDYVNYLNDLHQKVNAENNYEKVFLLGYSQGVSTAMRWLVNGPLAFNEVYLCSGSIPPEIARDDLKQHANSHFYYFYGNDDPLLSSSKAIEQFELLKKLADQMEPQPFTGGHIISDSCIDLISKHIESSI